MISINRNVHPLFVLSLLLCFHVNISANNGGYIFGTIQLDSTWENVIYLSVIEHFVEMNMMSYQMIANADTLDQDGNFKLNIDFLPETDVLIRLHVVKKGTSPASLIVGGEEENNTFLIANNTSDIQIYTMGEKPVFKDLVILNSSASKEFHYLTELIDYPNVIDYMTTPLDKRFVEEVVNEKLKLYADTCERSSLLALYALCGIDYGVDYQNDVQFYNRFLSKWDNDKSTYYEDFKQQLPVRKSHWFVGVFATFLLMLIVLFSVKVFVSRKNKINLQELSIRERKIFEMLQQGATNKEISEAFHIEVTTVKSHVSSIFSKLNVKSRKEVMDLK